MVVERVVAISSPCDLLPNTLTLGFWFVWILTITCGRRPAYTLPLRPVYELSIVVQCLRGESPNNDREQDIAKEPWDLKQNKKVCSARHIKQTRPGVVYNALWTHRQTRGQTHSVQRDAVQNSTRPQTVVGDG